MQTSVAVSVDRSLNSNKGIILQPNLQYDPESEIIENLKDQGITDVHRISIAKNNKKNTYQARNTHIKHPQNFQNQ